MNRKYSWHVLVGLALTIVFALNGCGGGSSSSTPAATTTGTDTVGATTVSGLTVAEKISVVDASSTSTKPALGKTTVK